VGVKKHVMQVKISSGVIYPIPAEVANDRRTCKIPTQCLLDYFLVQQCL